jgi:hypothetical protein
MPSPASVSVASLYTFASHSSLQSLLNGHQFRHCANKLVQTLLTANQFRNFWQEINSDTSGSNQSNQFLQQMSSVTSDNKQFSHLCHLRGGSAEQEPDVTNVQQNSEDI